MKKRALSDSLSIRLARAKRAADSRRVLRLLGGRGAATVLLGALLSVGGLSEAMSGVHFLVEKDLDAVRVVKDDGRRAHVVAKVNDGFAASSLFKLARVLPDRYVKRQLSLFDPNWIPVEQYVPEASQPDALHREMARIHNAIRRDFFAEVVPFGDLIHEKSVKYGVDPALVAAVVETESRFRSRARSQVGARGLMQLMPRTGRWMGARNLDDPEQNIDAGVKYIKYLSRRFDGNLNKTIAAYNAGEGNVRRYNGVPPFGETQTYVRKVLRSYARRNEQIQQFKQDSSGAVAENDRVLTVR